MRGEGLRAVGQVSFDAHDLMQRALEAIHRSAAVVVEFVEKGVGLCIEAGYAAALDIPIFVLLRPEVEMSVTLEGIPTDVFRYADDDSLNSVATRIADKTGRVAERPQRSLFVSRGSFRDACGGDQLWRPTIRQCECDAVLSDGLSRITDPRMEGLRLTHARISSSFGWVSTVWSHRAREFGHVTGSCRCRGWCRHSAVG